MHWWLLVRLSKKRVVTEIRKVPPKMFPSVVWIQKCETLVKQLNLIQYQKLLQFWTSKAENKKLVKWFRAQGKCLLNQQNSYLERGKTKNLNEQNTVKYYRPNPGLAWRYLEEERNARDVAREIVLPYSQHFIRKCRWCTTNQAARKLFSLWINEFHKTCNRWNDIVCFILCWILSLSFVIHSGDF